jgi:hypothetical protein
MWRFVFVVPVRCKRGGESEHEVRLQGRPTLTDVTGGAEQPGGSKRCTVRIAYRSCAYGRVCALQAHSAQLRAKTTIAPTEPSSLRLYIAGGTQPWLSDAASKSTTRHDPKRAASNSNAKSVDPRACSTRPSRAAASATRPAAAPKQRWGQLEEVLDYMLDNGLLFLQRYRIGNQRCAGGQGLVQFIEREHDGAPFLVKVRALDACARCTLCPRLEQNLPRSGHLYAQLAHDHEHLAQPSLWRSALVQCAHVTGMCQHCAWPQLHGRHCRQRCTQHAVLQLAGYIRGRGGYV